MTDQRARRPIPWGPILGVWTLYWLLLSAQLHFSTALQSTTPMPWSTSLLLLFPFAYVWALATPVILWLGRRFPVRRGHLALSVPVHVACCCMFVFLAELMYAWHARDVVPNPSPLPVLERAIGFFVGWILSYSFIYAVILAVGHAAEQQRELRERELTASQLETQLAQADLQALKMQLHPHFLFNALHTIGSLVRTGDRDNAVRVVAGLGDLLRRMLDGASSQEVPLRHELEFIRGYLDIEQVRFRDRLTVAIAVDDTVLDARVPHLILQPLVENAIRHGIGPHAGAGRISVVARAVDGRLQMLVQDDGPGIGEANGNGGGDGRPGIGLANTRERLRRLYGGDFTLEVCNASSGGLEARVEVPLRMTQAGA